MKKRLSAEDYAKKIRILQEKGCKKEDIMFIVGISYGTFYKYRNPAYDTHSRKTKEATQREREEIINLLLKGASRDEICEAMGLSRNQFNNWFKKGRPGNLLEYRDLLI